MRSLGTCFDLPPDPQVEHVITLMCRVFSTSAALMALVDTDRIFIRWGSGGMRSRPSPCGRHVLYSTLVYPFSV